MLFGEKKGFINDGYILYNDSRAYFKNRKVL